MEPLLSDITLASIVRDEIENPAGGIIDYIESTVPFFESAVVVDTGSVDGTYQALCNSAEKHSNLRVYSRIFDGFAPSRNFSLDKVTTSKAMILDADERLTEEDFKNLADFIKKNPSWGYDLEIIEVFPNRVKSPRWIGTLNPRIFSVEGTRFFSDDYYAEDIPAELCYNNVLTPPVKIKHFMPSEQALQRKKELWYKNKSWESSTLKEISSRDGWKKYNPMRENLNSI